MRFISILLISFFMCGAVSAQDSETSSDTSIFLYELFENAPDGDTRDWDGMCFVGDDRVGCSCMGDCGWFKKACKFLGGQDYLGDPAVATCGKKI